MVTEKKHSFNFKVTVVRDKTKSQPAPALRGRKAELAENVREFKSFKKPIDITPKY